MIQANICNSPILFNSCLDFSDDLPCPMTLESLKLDTHVQGDEFFYCSNFVVIYRVCFRLLSANLNTKFLSPFPFNSKGTILLEIKDDKPSVLTPKLLKWDKITIPEQLVIENNQPAPPIERDEIDQIIEEPNSRLPLDLNPLGNLRQRLSPLFFVGLSPDMQLLEKHLVKDLSVIVTNLIMLSLYK